MTQKVDEIPNEEETGMCGPCPCCDGLYRTNAIGTVVSHSIPQCEGFKLKPTSEYLALVKGKK